MPLPCLSFVPAEGYVTPEAAVLSQLYVKLLNDYLSEVGGLGGATGYRHKRACEGAFVLEG
jgi:hypothetical protein